MENHIFAITEKNGFLFQFEYMNSSSEESSSEINPEEESEQKSESSTSSDSDETFQKKLKEKIIIFTQPPQYVYNAIDKNNKEPSELSMKLRTRLGENSFTDFIERFKQEVEQRKQYEGFEKFSGPVCGIISSQLKQVLCLDTIEDFLAPDPSEVRHKFESILIQRQRSNLTSVIQIFGSLDPNLDLEHEFFIWMITQMCRITINYDEVCCDKNYKCIGLVTRLEKKKKKEKTYWILLGNDNVLTICDSQGEKEGEPIPVDLFSFSKKNQEKSKKSKDGKKPVIFEINVHQYPSAIRTKFDVDMEKNPAFDRKLWEYDSLRSKKVPFYRSLGYFETKYHPSYIEAAAKCIMHPLALILRSVFSYDDFHNPILNPSQSDEVFKSFFDLYLSQERAHEMINVMVVEGLLDSIQVNEAENTEGQKTSLFIMEGIEHAFARNPANQTPEQSQPGNNSKKSFLTFFTFWFLQKYSNNYFNRVICHIVTEIDLHPSFETKDVDETVNLIKYFVNTIIDNYDQISPQIHHFASILQNFVIVQWDQKFYLYLILKEFFFDLYIYGMIKEPRFWDNKFTLPNHNKRSPDEIKETADKFIQMIDVFLSADKNFEHEYPMFKERMDDLLPLQERMHQFILRLPVLTLDHCYNQDVSVLQQQSAISFILMTISEHPKEYRELIRKKKTRLINTPIFYSVAYFIRCLVSDKDNFGLLDKTDRQIFKVNYLNEESTNYSKHVSSESESESEINLEVPKNVNVNLPSSLQSIDSSSAKRKSGSSRSDIGNRTNQSKLNRSLNGSSKRSRYNDERETINGLRNESASHRLTSSSKKHILSQSSSDYEQSNKSSKHKDEDSGPQILSEGSYSDEDYENPKKILKKPKNNYYSDDYDEGGPVSTKSRNSRKDHRGRANSSESGHHSHRRSSKSTRSERSDKSDTSTRSERSDKSDRSTRSESSGRHSRSSTKSSKSESRYEGSSASRSSSRHRRSSSRHSSDDSDES